MLPVKREQLPLEIQQQIDIDSYGVRQTSSGSISLQRGKGQLDPQQTKGGHGLAADEIEALSAIIQALNFYKQITNDPAFAKALFDWLFERHLGRVETEQNKEST